MTNDVLAGLNVIITRPLKQGLQLAQRIQDYSGRAFHLPTLQIEPAEKSHLVLSLKAIDSCDVVIFISQNAVEQAAPFLPDSLTCKVAAIGPTTARALVQYGITVDFLPLQQFDSEHLVELPYFKTMNNKKVTLISGEGGREWLEERLKQGGAQVTKIVAYRRTCPKIDSDLIFAVTRLEKSVVLATSGESLHNLVMIMKKNGQQEWLFNQTLLVVSERMKQVASQLGFNTKQLILSDNATEQAILDSIIKWYPNQA